MGEIKTDTKKIESYSAKVDKNGMKIMSWGLGLLNQLVTAGDSVGEMYKNIKGSGQSKVSTENMSQEINTLSSFVNQFSQKIENKQTETKKMCNNLKQSNDNYVTGFNNVETALSGGRNAVLDNETKILISSLPDITNVKNVDFGKNWSSDSSKIEGWDDYTGQVKKFTDSVISAGYSTEQLNNLIEDNNKNIQDLRAKIKSGKLSEDEIKATKLQMKGLGELSKQLQQSYGTVSQTGHENELFTNNYIDNKVLTDDKKLSEQIEKDIIKYNNVINDENSSASEKGLASKNIGTLKTMQFMTNDELSDSFNENIEKQVSEQITNYVKSGLNTDTIKELLDESSKQVSNRFKNVISNGNMTDEELITNIYERQFYNELSKKLEELLQGSEKNDKQYDKWEDSYEKKYEKLIKNNSLTSSDIQEFISDIGKDVKKIQNQIKSGNLSDAEKMASYRKLKVLGQYNEVLGKNYGIVYNNEVKAKETLNQQKAMNEKYNTLVLNLETLDSELGELYKKQADLENKLAHVPSSEKKTIQEQYNKNEQEIKQKSESLKDANQKLSEFMCTVDSKYKEKYETEQQLQQAYDNLFQYQSELYSQTGGNVQSFYQNMISKTQTDIKNLESKLGYDENNSLNQTAVSYRKVQAKLNDLTNHASEYTEDEYNKQLSSLSAQLNGYEQQMFWEINKDKFDQLVDIKNVINEYDQILVSSNNAAEIQQISANKIAAKGTLEKLKTELGLDKSYDISVAQTMISKLKGENKSLSSENDILRKQLIRTTTNEQSYDIQEQIAENDKKISDNQKLIDQKNIEVNQLNNSNLVDAAKQLDGMLTTLYQDNAKLTSNLDFIGPKTPEQQEQLLLNNQQIEQIEALKKTYLDLSKMDANNGIESNIDILLDNYISETNPEMSTKKLNYYDNQVMQLLSVRDSVYQTKNSEVDALIEDNWQKIAKSTSDEEIGILKQEIEQLYQKKENESLKYSDSYNKVNEYWLKMHPPETEEEVIEDNRNWWEVVGATVAQTAMTVWHGVENATEAVLDFGVNATTGIISLGTSAVDLIGGNFGNPNCITQQLYNWKDDFVATDWVGNAAESIYNTDFGKWVDKNSFNHNSTEAVILRGIGEVAGTLAFASVGASALGATGAAASGMTGASTTVNALSQAKNMPVVVAGIKGFGQGLETALQEGANTVDAQAYAIASGSWDATQWIIGQQINGWTGAQLSGSTSALKSAGIFAASVGMDAIDSGLEGFVQPALQTIYKDDSYANIFKENGGWENVGAQAAIGGIMSAVSTAPDFVSSMKNVQIDAPTKVTGNQDILMENNVSISSKLENTLVNDLDNSKVISSDNLPEYQQLIDLRHSMMEEADYLNSLTPEQLIEYQASKIKPENKPILDDVRQKFSIDSDDVVVESYVNAMNYLLEYGTVDAQIYVKAMSKLKETNPDFKLISTTEVSCYSFFNKTLELNCTSIDNNDVRVTLHENGHALHSLVDDLNVPSDFWTETAPRAFEIMKMHYDEIRQIYIDNFNENVKAFNIIKQECQQNGVYEIYDNYYKEIYYDKINNEISKELDNLSINKQNYPSIFGKPLTEEQLVEYNNIINSSEIYKKMNSNNYFTPDSDTLNLLKSFVDKVSDESVNNSLVSVRAEFLRNELFGKLHNNMNSSEIEFSALSEMLTGLSGGQTSCLKKFDLEGSATAPGHSDNYVSRNPNSQYSEFVTEYMLMKLTGKEDTIAKMRYFCGDEFVDVLDSEYQNIMNNLRKLVED